MPEWASAQKVRLRHCFRLIIKCDAALRDIHDILQGFEAFLVEDNQSFVEPNSWPLDMHSIALPSELAPLTQGWYIHIVMSNNQRNVRKNFLPLTKLIPGNILVTMDVCSIHNNIPSSKSFKGIEIRLKR